MNFSNDKPTKSALYLVDRGDQGKWYRWYNADTDQWGLCGTTMEEAVEFKNKSAVGFFPWIGPLTGPTFKPANLNVVVTDDEPVTPAKPAKAKPAKKMAKMRTVPAAVSKNTTKVIHPDGTVFFREDRQKWVAMANGKQEAARPTAEACLKFLSKKYGITGTVIPKE